MRQNSRTPFKSCRTEPVSPESIGLSRSNGSSPLKIKSSLLKSSEFLNLRSSQPLKLSDLANSMQKSLNHRTLSPKKVKSELNKVKLYRFSLIFKLLNPNSRGKLIFSRALNGRIDLRLEQILLPVIENLAKIPAGITYREFCMKLDVLMKYLNDEDKYYLLSPHLYTPKVEIPNRHRLGSPDRMTHSIERSNRNCYSPYISNHYYS